MSHQLSMRWADLAGTAAEFCAAPPHHRLPYARRDWGGPLHSFCSYQGKLKPAIAHFLIAWFTRPGDRVLDPMSGVGTIPLEARRQGRVGLANDLSPLAATVSRAKLIPCDRQKVLDLVDALSIEIASGPGLEELLAATDVSFGLNGSIRDYFHADTLREVLIARRFLKVGGTAENHQAHAIIATSVLHILHGNRPYAISRRSHPITPFAPSGPTEYRSLIEKLRQRLQRVLPELDELNATSPSGEASQSDFRELQVGEVDAVITSPPFARSLRFWSSNWMRLWFIGWEPCDFRAEPARYLESQQRASYAPYQEFAQAMHGLLKPGGLLILHLGETKNENMAELVRPYLSEYFDVVFGGRESVENGESHGLRDKGSTVAHHYLFASRR